MILHHKPHLVGKSGTCGFSRRDLSCCFTDRIIYIIGLEEKFNWLSAFIYRQTRGWDLAALARVRAIPLTLTRTLNPVKQNTIEIKPTLPGEKKIGVIRNRKQISSKVQTIGEYVRPSSRRHVERGLI